MNIAEILRNTPKGTELYSPIFGTVEFRKLYGTFIRVYAVKEKHIVYFYKDGTYGKGGELMLFPSKENRDWSTFNVHKHFEPFQKVLFAGRDEESKLRWLPYFYSHYSKASNMHVLIGDNFMVNDDEILPYEGNEDKLGKLVKE